MMAVLLTYKGSWGKKTNAVPSIPYILARSPDIVPVRPFKDVNNAEVSHSGEEPDNEFSHPADSRSLADKGTVKPLMRYSLSQPITTLTC